MDDQSIIRSSLRGAVLGLALLMQAATPAAESLRRESFATTEKVGRLGANRLYTPTNQVLTPAGQQVELAGMRPQAIALSPDGRLLVTAGKTHDLVVLDPDTGLVRQHVALPSEKALPSEEEAVSSQILDPDKEGQLSYTGLVFSPDGRRLYLANVNGSIKVFAVDPNGTIEGRSSISLPASGLKQRKADIPAGLAASPDGRRLYAVLNLSDRLAEIDTASGRVLRMWQVGTAPFDVVLAGRKAYVSNWGGRRPDAGAVTGPAGRGTRVRVDTVRYIANEGSVSVIDLDEGRAGASNLAAKTEILVGLHASSLAVSPDRRVVVVANAASDTLSVIDTRSDRVVETIWARQNPADLFGAGPNALAFDRSGRTLFVCNGSQNAVAVVDFRPGGSRLKGLIPVGWYPGAIAYDGRRNKLHVANLKGMGPGRPRASNAKPEFNSHQYYGTLSLVAIPSARSLADLTQVVLDNLRYPLLRQASLPPRPDQTPRPVPERVGEPSVFRHVVYVIKENRTYDQVMGDEPRGNGDPELCIFGSQVTPNQHKLVKDFVLLDNTYCSGILSADGHQWADSAITTDYMERSFAGFPRSYPDGMGDSEVDALAYSPAGFIWDDALAHGRTVRSYGEFAITRKGWKDPHRKGKIQFSDHWRQFTQGTDEISLRSEPAIESLAGHMDTETIGWDMDVPDQWRADQFLKEFRGFEQSGDLPNLVIVCLPNDHTSGTKAGSPTPAAQAADNDLAFGRIIEAISRSRFWKETCIIAIEDDPQDGWDHVSGYRTTAYVVSPYTRRGAVVSTQYNQTSLLRTIELILGLPPMNQMDATATPMIDCFTDTPDLTPFGAVPNNIPLDQMNPEPKKISDALLRKDALASARLPLDRIDACPEDLFNHILWRAMKGTEVPYPAWAVRDDD